MPDSDFDKILEPKTLHPASRNQQHLYWYLRTNWTQAITRNMPEIERLFPEIREARYDMESLLRTIPSRSFTIFRPEDQSLTHSAGSQSAFLR